MKAAADMPSATLSVVEVGILAPPVRVDASPSPACVEGWPKSVSRGPAT